MFIGHKDFLPEVLKSGFFSTEHEPFPAAVARANQWIAESKVRVLNVETVVLPNVKRLEDVSHEGIRTSGELSSHWFQIVRVWYQTENPA
ncbi:MAG TPA: hypothetical protein VK327_12110 [Candidatus Paceibacterota bacterium]|nr:hypothetical protein [Candidatus Paceibacterota bacterium]